MYCLKFRDGRMVEWAMKKGERFVRRAPLSFPTKWPM